MKIQTKEQEEWLHRWYKELSNVVRDENVDLQLKMQAWELLNPPPKLTKEQEVKITIPKMNEED